MRIGKWVLTYRELKVSMLSEVKEKVEREEKKNESF